jgi:tetratricopeptide (TPR) repeat protein
MSENFNTINDFLILLKKKEYSKIISQGKLLLNHDNFKEKKILNNIIGLSYFNQLNYLDSIVYFKKSIEIDKNNFEAYNNLASSYLRVNDLKEAEFNFKKALERNPKSVNSHLLLSKVYLAGKKNEKAIQYLTSLKSLKDNINVIFEIGRIHLEMRNYNEALKWFQKAKKINPNSPSIFNNLGVCYENLNDIENCFSAFSQGLRIDKNNISIIINMANAHRSFGNFTEARHYYDLAIFKNPKLFEAHRQISSINKYESLKDKHLMQMLDLDKKEQNNNNKHELLFAISKAYEDLKLFDESGKYLVKANKLSRNKLTFDIKHTLSQIENLKSIFEKNSFKNNNQLYDKQPIFILGMPRSGTTLLEQVISSHRDVFSGGELYYLQKQIKKFFPHNDNEQFKESVIKNFEINVQKMGDGYINDISDLTEKKIVTDKLPFNFLFIGFIRHIFPDSKIIHIKRDSKDNCFSIYKNFFPFQEIGFVYDQVELAQYYNAYYELMLFWESKYNSHIYRVDYEKLVSNQEEETKKILKFCKLDWDENCLKFYKNKSLVKTLSTSQVRKKIYQSSINSWKNYEIYLKDLVSKLKY